MRALHDNERVGHRRAAVTLRFMLGKGQLHATPLNGQMGLAQYAHCNPRATIRLHGWWALLGDLRRVQSHFGFFEVSARILPVRIKKEFVKGA